MDGLGIGLAFQVSVAAGLVLAIAVLAHDLFDGANTVTLSLANGGSTANTGRWLAADAFAPLAGIAAAQLIPISATTLALLLRFLAGGILYIGMGWLLRSNQIGKNGLLRIVSVEADLGLIYAVLRAAGN